MGRGGGGGGSRSGGSHGGRGVTSGRGGGVSRSSGGSAHRSSYSGSSHHRGGGSFGGSRPSSRGGFGGPSRRMRAGMGGFGGYRPGPAYGGGYGGGGGCGCLSGLMGLVVALVLAVVLVPAGCVSRCTSGGHGSSGGGASQVTSTRTRTKLDASLCIPSENWVSDRAEWLDDKEKVVKALRYFYDKTGSQPYLVIATNVDGKTDFTDAEGEAWANNLYDAQFDDEGHTLVAFVEYEESQYAYYIICGSDAQEVIDDEAREMIANEINYWYTDTSLDDNEYFAKVFREAADDIMG